jgi:CheY-like chemotaxis protein
MIILKNILLVDDDEITNYINSDLIKSLNITENVTIANHGKEAIEYLEKAYQAFKEERTEPGYLIPDLIFLDINMPVMNGFQFLEAYNLRFGEDTRSTIITMLTTSFIKDEVAKALEMNQIVKGYIEKPLTKEIVTEIFNTHIKGKV